MKFFTPKGLKKSFEVQPEATVWFLFEICILITFIVIGVCGCVKMYKIGHTTYTVEDLKREQAESAEVEDTSVEDEIEYYDVPLNAELQRHIFNECDEHLIKPKIIFAMIERESSYYSDSIGDNGESFGLMQIQPKWNYDRMKKLGCFNLLDPFQNTSVGIDLIAELLKKGKPTEWALMAYNGGEQYANDMMECGLVSDYAQDVLNIMDAIDIL